VPDWQKIACAIALRATLTVITGGPGTGKTYTAARLLALLFAMDQQPGQLRIALAAPTGKAAARLRQSIDGALQALSVRLGDALDLARLTQGIGAAHTLHALLGASTNTRQFRHHAGNPLDVDVLIVDEASMVHLEMLSALLQALPAGAKLVLLGDKDQLASVEAGAVLGDLCRNASAGAYNPETRRYLQSVAGLCLPPDGLVPEGAGSPVSQQTVMLRESRRFGGMLGQLARAVNVGDSATAQMLLTRERSGELYAMQSPGVQAVWELAVRGRPGATACYADYLQCITERPDPATSNAEQHDQWVRQVLQAFDSFRVLCAVRDGEWGTLGLNRSIQTALAAAGWVKPKGEWFIGRPVMVTRNDASLGVFNGDVGIALPGPPGSVAPKVYFLDGDRLRSVGVGRLAHVETAFALTVHKSQGSEFLHVALVLPPGGAKVLSRALVYTGMTRARACLTLFEAQPGLLQTAIATRSERTSGLF
jgi:exodeoxyribonuclease V alpha subunit